MPIDLNKILQEYAAKGQRQPTSGEVAGGALGGVARGYADYMNKKNQYKYQITEALRENPYYEPSRGENGEIRFVRKSPEQIQQEMANMGFESGGVKMTPQGMQMEFGTPNPTFDRESLEILKADLRSKLEEEKETVTLTDPTAKSLNKLFPGYNFESGQKINKELISALGKESDRKAREDIANKRASLQKAYTTDKRIENLLKSNTDLRLELNSTYDPDRRSELNYQINDNRSSIRELFRQQGVGLTEAEMQVIEQDPIIREYLWGAIRQSVPQPPIKTIVPKGTAKPDKSREPLESIFGK